MKARKENTFRNNIVAANLFPHKLLGMAARLGMAVVKMVVVVIWKIQSPLPPPVHLKLTP